jgi:hypothetical protein
MEEEKSSEATDEDLEILDIASRGLQPIPRIILPPLCALDNMEGIGIPTIQAGIHRIRMNDVTVNNGK